MKLSDFVIDFLASQKIKHVFTVTGGACAHLIDSFHGRKDISYVCVQHEQAGAMAAEAYSRVGPGLGTVIVTSGPGATNLITGICCAWFDSIPCLFISGQVNTFESRGDLGVRQVGFQETDIISIVQSVTKNAEMVLDPQQIRYQLEKAVHLAQSGRPGPVLLDIPMNIQRAEVDPEKLQGYQPSVENEGAAVEGALIQNCLQMIRAAQRPMVLAGGGLRIGGAIKEFFEFLKATGIPVVTTWSGIDLLAHDHPLYVGQIGVYGNRGANFAIQNSDLLISLGSRLDTRQTGGRPETFARGAKKIVVDVDPEELKKRVHPDVAVCADVKVVLGALNQACRGQTFPLFTAWQKRTREWKDRYPAVLPEWRSQEGSVNAYVFMEALSKALAPGDVIVTDCGGNLTWTIQGFHVKENQRLFSAMGNSPMGYSLPAAIGACVGLGGQRRVIGIIGDGGLQMNIQEFQTIKHYNLPIKLFIMNNHSYGIIKQFQEMYFSGRYEATVKDHGYSFPDFVKVAQAYGLRAETIVDHTALSSKLNSIISSEGSVICDVNLSDDQKLVPKLEFNRSIEDQTPYLDRKEFLSNMIVDPLPESLPALEQISSK